MRNITNLIILLLFTTIIHEVDLLNAEVLYRSQNIFVYDRNYLSIDKSKIAIYNPFNITDSSYNNLSDIRIIDTSSGETIAELSTSKELGYQGRLVLDSISWASNSQYLFFVMLEESHIIYQWDIIDDKLLKFIIKDNSAIKNISNSKDGKYLSYIYYSLEKDCKLSDCWKRIDTTKILLHISLLNKKKLVKEISNVDVVQPYWDEDGSLIYSKSNIVYRFTPPDKIEEVVKLEDRKVLDFFSISLNKFAIICSKSKSETIEEALKLKGFFRELWVYNNITNKVDNPFSYRTFNLGLAMNSSKIIIPLSSELASEYSALLMYRLPKKEFNVIASMNHQYGFPLFISSDEILVLKDFKQLIKISLEE